MIRSKCAYAGEGTVFQESGRDDLSMHSGIWIVVFAADMVVSTARAFFVFGFLIVVLLLHATTMT